MLTRNQQDHSLSGNPTRGTWPSAWPIPRRPGSTSLSVISTAPGWRARSRRSGPSGRRWLGRRRTDRT